MAVKCILTGQTPSVLDGVTENVQSQIDNKVNKVTGKGLSTEDYTTIEKTKLSGIEEGAQKNTVTSVAGKTGAVTLAKDDVGLSNVDNTSDESKPISTATQTALDKKQDKLPDGVTIDNSEISLMTSKGYNPTSFQVLDDGNSFVSVSYSAGEDSYYGFSAPLEQDPNLGQIPNRVYLISAHETTSSGGQYVPNFTTPVSLKNVADPTDWTDAANKQWTDTFVKNISETNIKGALSVNGILKGDGAGAVTAAEETEVELVEVTADSIGAASKEYVDSVAIGTTLSVTLASASWTGTAAPYTYTISNSVITTTSTQEVSPAIDITADQLTALQNANIIDGGQAAGSMTLKAFGEKPSVDIPVRIIVKG